MGFLIPEVFILLLTDIISAVLILGVTPFAYQIAKKWDSSSTENIQYKMEKRRTLLSAVIGAVFVFKIPLYLYFIHTHDKMSAVITGAMCAAGTLNATAYSSPLLYVKTASVYLMFVWLALQRESLKKPEMKFTKTIYSLFLLISVSVLAETVLLILNFSEIDPAAVVSCCSSIYSSSGENSSFLTAADPFISFIVFNISAVFLTVFAAMKKPASVSLFSVVFFFTAVLTLILFTSTYIYELPSHRCPFCILQKEYGYIGYVFYITLFLSTASGIASYPVYLVNKKNPRVLLNTALAAAIVFWMLNVWFPIRFYLINNTWL